MLAIRINNLSRHFASSNENFEVLKQVNLNLELGACVAILGANGAGKTTLFRILNTLILPSSGSVQIMQADLVTCPEKVRAMVAWSSGQEGGFFNRFTGLENLFCFAAMDGVSKGEVLDQLKQLEQIKPLEKALQTPYYLCSAGMKQCLSIALAVVVNKPILLLDEPTRSLDEKTADSIRELIRQLKGQKSIVFSTHRREDLAIADQVWQLEDGCLNKLN